MPPQQQAEAGAESAGDRRTARRMSGRAQRRVAQEQAERRKRLTLVGSAVGIVLLAGLIFFLLTRPPDLGPPIVAGEPLPA